MKNSAYYLLFICLVSFFSCGENKQSERESEQKESSESKENNNIDSQEGVILFFGNSITAGMGLDTNEAFPAIIERKIDSLDLPYTVINAGLSGETTASGKNRLDWVLNQKVDVFVLELGANDGLRGLPLEETRKNLQDIIAKVREKNPGVKIILAGMEIPPNLGPEYTSGFRKIFSDLAKEKNVHLIPFLLEGVAGDPALNQEDGIHPTAEGYEIVAKNVWEVLWPVLKSQKG